jgi:peptide/nickel transport system permease protein
MTHWSTLLKFFLRRLAYGIPVLLAVSVIAFFFSTSTPGDVVEEYIASHGDVGHTARPYEQQMEAYHLMATKLNRHLPVFYVGVHPVSFPDTLHRIVRKEERSTMKVLLRRHGDWQRVQAYRNSILAFVNAPDSAPDQRVGISRARQDAEYLLITSDPQRIEYLLGGIADATTTTSVEDFGIQQAYDLMIGGGMSISGLLPTITWHGTRNQYHKWLTGMLQGDFGISLVDGRPVGRRIGEAIRWTLRINITVILLAFLIAIPLGVWTARRAGSVFDRVTNGLLFAFFAIPSFWLATLFVVFLTSPEYGEWTNLFPTAGVGDYNFATTFGERLRILVTHLFLPVLCLLLATSAYLTRQMRGSVIQEARKDYVRMARARGFPERTVYWRYAARNALFPMITLVGSAVPAAVSGSVIIEVIFNIPGMGRLLYESILSNDWTVVFTMLMLATVLTVIGYILSDILYHVADPRVRLGEL